MPSPDRDAYSFGLSVGRSVSLAVYLPVCLSVCSTFILPSVVDISTVLLFSELVSFLQASSGDI